MYILSQDKSKIIKFSRIDISRNFGGKRNEKFALIAWAEAAKNTECTVIGIYPDEGEARVQLEHIAEALNNNMKIYELS